jgi:hypothetical protein
MHVCSLSLSLFFFSYLDIYRWQTIFEEEEKPLSRLFGNNFLKGQEGVGTGKK